MNSQFSLTLARENFWTFAQKLGETQAVTFLRPFTLAFVVLLSYPF